MIGLAFNTWLRAVDRNDAELAPLIEFKRTHRRDWPGFGSQTLTYERFLAEYGITDGPVFDSLHVALSRYRSQVKRRPERG